MFRRLGMVGIVLASGGCGNDVFLPPAEEPTAEPTVEERIAAIEAWVPSLRVIGVDGIERADFVVFIDNGDYYDRFRDTVFASFFQRRSGGPFTGTSVDPEAIHPPIRLRVDDPDVAWWASDLMPLPGETIIVDLRESTHAINLTWAVPDAWGDPDFRVSHRFRAGVPGWVDSDALGCCERATVAVAGPGRVAFRQPRDADEIVTAELTWSVDGALSPEGHVAVVRATQGFDEPDAAFVDGEASLHVRSRERVVDLRIAGERIPDLPVVLGTSSREESEFAWTVGHVAVEGLGPHRIIALEDEFDLAVQRVTPRFLFPSHQTFASGDADDTLRVDLGPHRVTVTFRDADGDPIEGGLVTLEGAEGRTDDIGQVLFYLPDGIFRFRFRPGTHVPSRVVDRVVRSDRRVDLTWDD